MRTDKEYLVMAYNVATSSPDPSTQNGAVIPYCLTDEMGVSMKERFISACNTFPEGVQNTPERLVRPLKYNFIEHAERGAILAAAKEGIPLSGLTMYVPWAACSDCARAIICSGIRRLVLHKDMMDRTPDHWKESIKHAFEMFSEAEIAIEYVEGKLDAPAIRMNGELWQP